jgi:eukaryotic-like serine/threonine-protein kinase
MEVALARVHRAPDLPMSLPEQWRTLLRAMTLREPAQRPSAQTVADSLRRIAAGEDLDRTVAMAAASPTSTQVLPATAVATQAAWPAAEPTQTAVHPVAGRPARRGPSAAVVVLVLLLVAAAAAGAIIAVHNSNSGSTTSFTPGQPRLHPPKIERDLRHLERLVHR